MRVRIISYCVKLPVSIRRNYAGWRGVLLGSNLSELVIETGCEACAGRIELFLQVSHEHCGGWVMEEPL